MSPESASNSDKLVQSLFNQIVESVRQKDFNKADTLRSELIDKVPTALSEIIKSDTIIEEAKTAALDKDHLAIWDSLYQDLTEEEVNCLYYSMKKVKVPPKKRILAHGGMNNKLFFIDKGQVTVFFPKDGKNIVIAQLGRGDLLGEYTFATISLCSASVVSNTDVELRYIESETAAGWLDKEPVLYDKVVKYCNDHGKIDDIIKQKSLEKRQNKRYDAKGLVVATLLSKEGKKTESILKGGLSNISITGCCFEIRASKLEMAKALLARHFYLQIETEKSGKKYHCDVVGKVVRVSSHLHNEYSVHIRFIKPFGQEVIKPLIV